MCEHKDSHLQTKETEPEQVFPSQSSEEANLMDILISDFSVSELWETTFMLLSHSVCGTFYSIFNN